MVSHQSARILLSCLFVGLFLVGCRSNRSQMIGTAAKDAGNLSSRDLVKHTPTSSKENSAGSEKCPLEKVLDKRSETDRPSRTIVLANHETEAGESAPLTQSPTAPFAPKSLCPISPAELMDSGPIPTGYQARLDELNRVGAQLAKGAQGVDAKFQFDSIYNPRRASTCHTEAGHILVTSSLLERVQTRHQLAAALAIEMAEYIREQEHSIDRRAAVTAGVPKDAKLSDPSLSSDKATEAEINETASQLLTRAGFEQIDVVAMRADLQGLLAGSLHATARPRSDGTIPEPKWNGPQPATAN